jgi:lipopolysaccharide export system protein LptC
MSFSKWAFWKICHLNFRRLCCHCWNLTQEHCQQQEIESNSDNPMVVLYSMASTTYVCNVQFKYLNNSF